ncbi:Nucleotide-binding universal stress protein, UspA family [Gemmobacter aquatilis]|uniref:Nucleotide-binding universal stress protein, UspA family n=1 Tax=Gemmobacter aquatilis TaxID=933059 RepID=A0A1H8I8D2_9RHOB|nr:universal stress protein [Gemmobacter aquatilis]SEN64522.1 Nucleotide-binding universal stress protein, UspA family [Gemmobacter aquatilis]
MAYKTLSTVVTSAAEAAATVAAAGRLAVALDAHLDILALGIDRTQVGYSYVGGSGVLLQVAMERAEEEARETEAAVRAAAAEQPFDLRWSVEGAVSQIGALTELVARRARFADLVVLPKPYGKGRSTEAEAVVEAAMFEGQTPVLVLPGTEAPALPSRIVIGWNQSREAMVAVRAALPFLQAAQMVNIAVIDPPQHGPERSDPGGMLCQMLVRHGVKAEVSVLARSMPRISDVLARHMRDVNGEMLVMGAYGHSRFREAILGGATRNMLEQAETPVFLAH